MLDAAQRRAIAPPGAGLRALGAILHGIARPLVRRFFRLRIEGLKNLPDEGSVIIPFFRNRVMGRRSNVMHDGNLSGVSPLDGNQAQPDPG